MDQVCLIIPPSPFLLDERVFVSLGILKVAAVLEKNGYKTEVLDLSGVQNYTDVVRDYVSSSSTKIYGITSTTPQMPAAYNIRAVLGDFTGVKVILGGPHPTLVGAAYKKEVKKAFRGRAHTAFEKLFHSYDVLVLGDGEKAILRAIQEDCLGVVDGDDPTNDFFLKNQELNESPYPARHLVDLTSYNYTIEGHRATSLIAQLGCPFGCGFCGGRESAMLRRIRTRTTENIVKEIEDLYHTYKFTGFMLYDDELNVNKNMIELMNGISDLQTKLNQKFALRGFIKSQLFTDEQAKAMVKAGFKWILVGFESGSPMILDNMNKKATREQNTRCFHIARNNGLKIKALMSLGHPGESRKTIYETGEWLLQVKPDDFDVTIITTYPGSPYYDDAILHESGDWVYKLPNGDNLYQKEIDYTTTADYYKGDPNGGYKSYVYTDTLSCDDLVAIRDSMEKNLRAELKIPFNPSNAAMRYEHSMGQIPLHILRSSK